LVENAFLAAIIYGTIYLEGWAGKRKTRKEENRGRQQIIQFVKNDLNNKLRFIEESVQYQDFKPFFTDMWDATILGGRQTLLPFSLFQNLQHTYSWMKYYNNELEQWQKNDDNKKEALEILGEVKKSIAQSLDMLQEL
jgi:hypothetical protein